MRARPSIAWSTSALVHCVQINIVAVRGSPWSTRVVDLRVEVTLHEVVHHAELLPRLLLRVVVCSESAVASHGVGRIRHRGVPDVTLVVLIWHLLVEDHAALLTAFAAE